MSLLSAPRREKKKTAMKSPAEACCAAQIVFVSKQVRTIVTGRQRDPQTIKVLGAYTLLRWFSTTNNTPWGKEATLSSGRYLDLRNFMTNGSQIWNYWGEPERNWNLSRTKYGPTQHIYYAETKIPQRQLRVRSWNLFLHYYTIFSRSACTDIWHFMHTFSNIHKKVPASGVRNTLQNAQSSIQIRFLYIPSKDECSTLKVRQ